MTIALLQPTRDRGLHHRRSRKCTILAIYALLSALMLLDTALTSAAAQSGDVAAGRQLVQAHCSACHDAAGPSSTPRQAPSLRAVAAMPSTTSLSLHVFLLTPHPSMPDYHLTRQEVDDVVLYILSLRR